MFSNIEIRLESVFGFGSCTLVRPKSELVSLACGSDQPIRFSVIVALRVAYVSWGLSPCSILRGQQEILQGLVGLRRPGAHG